MKIRRIANFITGMSAGATVISVSTMATRENWQAFFGYLIALSWILLYWYRYTLEGDKQ